LKDFFEKLNALRKPKRNDIIEKDYHLHRLLHEISQDDYLRENLIFKGGTCLLKAYLGYYRFSEDIDFTWKRTDIWKNRNKTETTRLCSREITKLVNHFKPIFNSLGLSFSGDKSNTEEVHISSGGRMIIFFPGYKSEILDIRSRIKVEINFVDTIVYPLRDMQLKSYIEGTDSEELRFLYEDQWREYDKTIQLTCYDPEEIFIEKCRASMTRKAYKLRDIIDLYFIERKYGYNILDHRNAVKEKVKFMLDMYKRYQENIDILQLPSIDLQKNEEMKLMIVTPPKDLEGAISNIHHQLKQIRMELLNELK